MAVDWRKMGYCEECTTARKNTWAEKKMEVWTNINLKEPYTFVSLTDCTFSRLIKK